MTRPQLFKINDIISYNFKHEYYEYTVFFVVSHILLTKNNSVISYVALTMMLS